MAKLSAHGTELGRLDYTTYRLAFMSDGNILRNQFGEWKLYKKLKNPSGMADYFAAAKAKQESFLAARPALAEYRQMLHKLAGMAKSWKLDAAISMMPDDADGVWSEVCDGWGDNVHADLDEIAELCALYRAAMVEREELRDSTNALATA